MRARAIIAGARRRTATGADIGPLLTATGTPIFAAGHFGNAYDPNGGKLASQEAIGSAGLTEFTIEAWVNQTGSATVARTAFNASGTGTSAATLGMASNGKPVLVVGTYNYNFDANPLGTGWHHLAISKTAAGAARLFIDGALRNSITGSGAVLNWPTGFAIGRNTGDTNQWIGQIDEMRISTVARYTAAFTPQTVPFDPDANTLALYHFESNL